ncbi:ABC-2 type transport system permease protein [Oceanobacillus limi]|uniref:ABC-2 type transport system permease protein n=1 Tax=Oceanobacillus limi TaxID=930131 RepID=A0A1H9YKE4_9BACI|nr:ABC transporter permease [Oceanobacillus limi]SES69005.1 ABC-2 type transport system permease protein [Oceanobacillus limi]
MKIPKKLKFRKGEEETKNEKAEQKNTSPVFSVIVRKEFTDFIKSWRIIILLIIIILTCMGSLYTAITTIQDTLSRSEDVKEIAKDTNLFLQLFTTSDGTLPPFVTFVSFLGPLLGIALGFDAVNAERNKGTLTRLMSQPVPRDYVINAKFLAALLVSTTLFFALGFIVMALGILIIGIPPTFEEFLRILCFLCLCVAYIGFWLNLGILFSVRFKQAATSALSSIAVWIFFSVFYNMIIDFISKGYLNPESITSTDEAVTKQETILNLMRLSPNYLFSESTTTLLSPSVRSLGPLTMEQTVGAITGPLPFGQSLLLIWPQLTGLIAATLICFAIAYVLFMRQEIRTN